ncbi:MAG: hypothetical protein D6731_00460 [Planctomycetota bacterium]|nr:MAG: hypothetical protein D6731_00460 [Planctomycetota bacterium]
MRSPLPFVLSLAVACTAGAWVGAQDAEPSPLPAHRTVDAEHFATSSRCALCHASSPRARGLRDAEGRSIAPFDLWRSTMMANASRDPLWRAAVSVEVAATPSRKAAIEAKCMRCHAPLASETLRLAGAPAPGLDLLREDSDLGQLALDGVSCTLCHQVQPELLGARESFGGGFRVGRGRRIFGPHADPFAMPMVRHSGFRPVQGEHLRDSALCATCHTLFTDSLDAEGRPTGAVLPEQTPYLEWRNSVYNDEVEDLDHRARSCQDCHVPVRDAEGRLIETRIARNPMGGDFRIPERSPVGQHIFIGGNTLVPAILRDRADVLRPNAPREAFDRTIALAREQLSQRTARLWVRVVERSERRLHVRVRVENLTGHKFPTGHPTRRAWLRLRVRNAAGQVLFASGEHDAQGRIVDDAGTPLPTERRGGGLLAHRTRVTSSREAVVYEAVLADAEGRPTYLLLRGVAYLKDNRLLPVGWKPEHPAAVETAPRGTEGDPDHRPGEDSVDYFVDLPARAGPLTVEATLFYQVLGARYADELFAWDTPEVRFFRSAYEAADRRPVPAASAEVRVP